MRLLVVPTAAAGINFEAAVECMCSAAIGTVVAAAVLESPGKHCSLAVGAATAVVVGVVATVAVSDAGAAIFDVSVVALVDDAVTSGVAMLLCLMLCFPRRLFVQYKPALLHLFCHYPSIS